MYKLGEKLIATIIVMIILLAQLSLIGIYGNQVYATNQLQNNITQTDTQTEDISAKLENNLIKFMKFSNNGKKGVLLQTKINSSVVENKVATTQTYIKATSPKINEKEADEIKVTANSTAATNGDKIGVNFTKENYNINKQDGYVEITVKNEPDSQGQIYWLKNVEDEYLITYVYYLTDTQLAKIYDNTELILTTVSKISTNDQKIITKNASSTQTVTEQKGNLIDFSSKMDVASIGKGYIYTNYESEIKNENIYNETLTVDMGITSVGEGTSTISFMDKIVATQEKEDKFESVDFALSQEEQNQAIEQSLALPITTTTNNTYYKNIAINKDMFTKFFGNDGYIKVYNNETLIGTINKDTVINTENNKVLDLSELKVSTIKIETSKPLVEGTLKLNISKAINSNLTYTKTQMSEFNMLLGSMQIKGIISETAINESYLARNIKLTEPENKTEILLNNQRLSTLAQNENVEIKAVLRTDSDTCLLYDNPTIKITLPKYIESINVKSAQLLFSEELTIKNAEYLKNPDGTTTINIEIEGKQTKYDIGAISGGANIVIVADMTVNRLTPSKQENIVMECFNKSKAKISEASNMLYFAAPTGIISTNAISNYAEGEGTLRAITDGKVGTIDTGAASRIATFNMDMVNNYENTISNVSILGRMPYKGNKTILTNEDLSSTFGLKLLQKLNVQVADSQGTAISGMNKTIYYSENGEATKDVSLNSNGWTTEPQTLDNIKSYLIVCEGAELNIGDIISFNYNAEIPENLEYYQNAFETYAVYFDNNKTTGTIQDKIESAKLGITTGESVLLEASMTSNVEEATYVQSGKFIKYTITAKNTGTKISKNTIAKVALPDCIRYIEFITGEAGIYNTIFEKEELTIDLGTINPNDTVTKDFWVVVNNSQDKDTISVKATITADELVKPINTNEVTNKVKKAIFMIGTSTTTNGIEKLNENDKFNFNINVSTYKGEAQNTVIISVIPEGLNYKEAKIEYYDTTTGELKEITDGITYDESSKTVTVNFGTVSESTNKKIKITSEIGKINESDYKKVISNIAKVKADGIEEETSNPIYDTIVRDGIKISQTCTIPEGTLLSAGEKYAYKITVENIGGKDTTNISIVDELPNELQYVSTIYSENGEQVENSSIDENNKITVSLNIAQGEEQTITINVIAKELPENKKITNKVLASTDTVSTIEANKITHTIEKVDYVDINDPTTQTRKITGTVWIDKNKDGIKDEDEERLSGVKVLLYNNDTKAMVTDSLGLVSSITDNEGIYIFKNIPKGNYTAIFMYNTSNYSSTIYRKDGVSQEKNSDAIDSKLTIDGESKVAAITEPIVVGNDNIYNIDLGLVVNPKFDLRLDKTVSEITVQNSEGTTINQFNDTKLAKQEIVGKYIDSTTLIIKYNIKVTNEGAIDAYVKKIADYVPSSVGFSTELNKDWYSGENGTIFNSSLANTKLAPGEAKTVSLLVTMKTSDSKLGTIINKAEIYEASNDLGLEDIDSNQANKSENEDDMSQAQVLISIKTGEAILYIGLAILIIAIIGTGIYFINKKVIK